MSVPTKYKLVIIDAQNDFCDLPSEACPIIAGSQYKPAMPILGAHLNCLNLANFIGKFGYNIDSISVYMDSHIYADIGHCTSWLTELYKPVPPYTTVTFDDFMTGKVQPINTLVTSIYKAYLQKAQAIMVWPVHTLIGTYGHNIHYAISDALNVWQYKTNGAMLNYILKGSNPFTEHYSAIQAEIVTSDPQTHVDLNFVDTCKYGSTIFAGQAASHCVRKTLVSVLDNLDPCYYQNLIVLRDCMNPVSGHEQSTDEFFDYLQSVGVTVTTSTQYIKKAL
jgi:nicotinamidase/pyrazinamidase